MADDLEYYRNKCIQLQAQMTAKDKAHADEHTEIKAENAQIKAENAQIKAENAQIKAENAQIKAENAQIKAENAQIKAENKQLKAKIEENQNTQNAQIAALKGTVSALAAKNLGIKDRKKRSRKKSSGKHPRTSRKRPERVDAEVIVDDPNCKKCGSELSAPCDQHERVVEDISFRSIVTKYTVVRRYCKTCKKQVSAPVPDTLPNEPFGMRLMLFVASLNLMGVSCAKISKMVQTFFGTAMSPSTANRITLRIAREFGPLYEDMKKEIRKQPSLHGDETSWPIRGKKYWLWAFISKYAVLYEIHEKRSRVVPKMVLGDYKGTIISDSWGAWNYVGSEHQRCHIHYLRFIKDILKYYEYSKEFALFGKTLKRILNDSHKPNADKDKLLSRIDRLVGKEYQNTHCVTMVKRILRERNMLFTFIGRNIDWHNNTAERAVRPSVVLRKITYGSNSLVGAKAHRTLMSVYQTCNMQNKNFVDFSMNYLNRASKS